MRMTTDTAKHARTMTTTVRGEVQSSLRRGFRGGEGALYFQMSNVVPPESALSGALVWDGRKRVASVLACDGDGDGDGDDDEARAGMAAAGPFKVVPTDLVCSCSNPQARRAQSQV
jgi:hypothetical protein